MQDMSGPVPHGTLPFGLGGQLAADVVEILVVEGRSYRRREAELTQQQRKRPRRNRPRP